MKRLIFIFVALFMLIMLSGCGTNQNTIRYNNGESDEGVEASDEISEEEASYGDSEESSEDKGLNASSAPSGKLAVTSFDSALLKTNLSYNVVKGTTRSNTNKITINDYQLQKYYPGQTQWSYIASTRFNTLKDGLNTYIVKTFDSSGKQTESLIFTIDYEAPIIPAELPGVGANHWLTLMASLMISGSYLVFRKYKWL